MITAAEMKMLADAIRALGWLLTGGLEQCYEALTAVVDAYTELLLLADESEHVPVPAEKIEELLRGSVRREPAEQLGELIQAVAAAQPDVSTESTQGPDASKEEAEIDTSDAGGRSCMDCGCSDPAEFDVVKQQHKRRCITCFRARRALEQKRFDDKRRAEKQAAQNAADAIAVPGQCDHAWRDDAGGSIFYIDRLGMYFTVYRLTNGVTTTVSSLLTSGKTQKAAVALVELDAVARDRGWTRVDRNDG